MRYDLTDSGRSGSPGQRGFLEYRPLMMASVMVCLRGIAARRRLIASLVVLIPWLAQELRAQVVLESGGVVVIEAEEFNASRPTDTHAWFRIPDDAQGVGEFANARGGYIQPYGRAPPLRQRGTGGLGTG